MVGIAERGLQSPSARRSRTDRLFLHAVGGSHACLAQLDQAYRLATCHRSLRWRRLRSQAVRSSDDRLQAQALLPQPQSSIRKHRTTAVTVWLESHMGLRDWSTTRA